MGKQKIAAKTTTSWVEDEYGLKLSEAPGVGGECHPHILSYKPGGSMLGMLAPIASSSMTVCPSLGSWVGHLLWLFYALCLMVILGYSAFPDGEFGNGHPCKGGNGANVSMCQLNSNLEKSVGEFRFLIAFILAGYVGRVVQMWATRRKNYAALCGATRELNVLMGSFLPHPTATSIKEGTSPLPQTARQTLARWIILAYELAVLKSKGLMDNETQGRAYLDEHRGLLQPGEWDAMVPGDRHTTVYFWIQSYMVHLEQLGHIHPSYVLSYSQAVGRARAQANDLMSSLDRDLPFPYVNLCFILVCLNVLIFTTFKAVLWSTWLYQHGTKIGAQPVFWIDLGVTFAWNLSYTSLYQLSYVLYNPFGNSKIDVAHETIGLGLQSLANHLAQAHTCVPVELVQSATAIQQKAVTKDLHQSQETALDSPDSPKTVKTVSSTGKVLTPQKTKKTKVKPKEK